ncbi:MAG: ATP-binding protein [Salinivirgaceae bacterium]|nr:ATP-binding protein [Salinivirgaceae bacterium]
MEENADHTRIVVITGAESTGKTELAKYLADHLNWEWIPELSRTYVEKLKRPYIFNDIEIIAQQQIAQFNVAANNPLKTVVFDTGLIITKVWFDVVYNKCPDWLIDAIYKLPKVLHLLCDIDLPWQSDSVRENGGAMRIKLNDIYKRELDSFGFEYELVSGTGNQRLMNALRILKEKGLV